MRILAVFFGFFVLSGCAGSVIGDRIAGPEKLAEQDGAKCESFGAVRGSAPYIQCMVEMDNQRAANHRTAIAGMQQSIQGFQPVQPNYQIAPTPNPLANQPAPTNTTCSAIGPTINCRTY